MVVRFRDGAAVARAAAAQFVDASFKAIREHGDFRVALAGGNTPRQTYEVLAQEKGDEVDWRRVIFYFGDERCVGPDDPRSNFRMAKESLFDPLHLSLSNVHRIAGELEPTAAAAEYDADLRRLQREQRTIFDLVLLGMGPEGHTASLFPGSPALEEGSHLASAVTVAAQPANRITLTPAALASTRAIVFLVTGGDKAQALASVFSGEPVPAATVAQLAPTQFFADEAAAANLP